MGSFACSRRLVMVMMETTTTLMLVRTTLMTTTTTRTSRMAWRPSSTAAGTAGGVARSTKSSGRAPSSGRGSHGPTSGLGTTSGSTSSTLPPDRQRRHVHVHGSHDERSHHVPQQTRRSRRSHGINGAFVLGKSGQGFGPGQGFVSPLPTQSPRRISPQQSHGPWTRSRRAPVPKR